MKEEKIKGMCENCGHAFVGTVKLENGGFPVFNCPKCGEETQNFDSAYEVDRLNKADGHEIPNYIAF